MLIKLKSVVIILVCATLLVQLQGCFFERRDHRADDRHHDHGPDHAELDVRVH